MQNPYKLTDADLFELFQIKYNDPDVTDIRDLDWGPGRRLRYNFYQPDDIYEAVVEKLVNEKTKWIDVGGGRAIFPSNMALSEALANRCQKMVAVDPSPNVTEHPYAHEKVMAMYEDFKTEEKFDLATFRMVAEHVQNPDAVAENLKSMLNPGGKVVIYTINKYSPVPILTYITPFSVHFKVKKFFWGGEEKDTFPVAYKMNTRKELQSIFERFGFVEDNFQYLDDLSTLERFKFPNLAELSVWKLFSAIGLRYPENNLLGVYRKLS